MTNLQIEALLLKWRTEAADRPDERPVLERCADELEKLHRRYEIALALVQTGVYDLDEKRRLTTEKLVCDHGVTFDKEAARGLSSSEICKRWPRFSGICTKCGYTGIAYASYEHYISGDW